MLGADAIGLTHVVLGDARDLCDQRLVLCRRLPVPQRLAGFFHQLMDQLDHRLHLLMSVDDAAQHHFLGQLVRFGFDHQDRRFRPRDDEIELRCCELGLRRIQHIRAIDVADARRADRTAERNAGQCNGRRCTDQRRNVRIDFRIHRQHRCDDLHVVVETVRKERPQRPIDQPGRQRFLFARTAFTFEKPAGDFARGVSLFLIIDGQREKILTGFRLLRGDGRDQHDAIVETHDHGAASLSGDFARFDRQRMAAVGNRFFDGSLHSFLVMRTRQRPHRCRCSEREPLRMWGARASINTGRRTHCRDRMATSGVAKCANYLRRPSFSISAR